VSRPVSVDWQLKWGDGQEVGDFWQEWHVGFKFDSLRNYVHHADGKDIQKLHDHLLDINRST